MPGNILIITFIAIITHGWIFLSNAEIWDGWYVRDWIKNGHLDYLARYYQEAGHPFFGWVHLHANWLSNVSLFYHFLAFGSLLGTALGIYWILTAKNLFTQNERLWLAIFILVYPGFLVATDSVVTLYLVCYFLFILGWCLLLLSHQERTSLKFLYRVSSLGLFFLSFFTNSILVFYYGFLAIWFFLDFRNVKTFLARYWIFVILPLAFWGWSKAQVTRAPIHQDYYKLQFKISSVFENIGSFFTDVLGSQIFSFPQSVVWIPVFVILSYWLIRNFSRNVVQKTNIYIFVVGIFLLVCALLPYTVVNQGFGLMGWITKNNLLLALPIGLIAIGIWKFAAQGKVLKWELLFKSCVPALVILLCILAQTFNYLRYQSLEAKHRAVALSAVELYKTKPFSVCLIEDKLPIKTTNDTLPPALWSSVISHDATQNSPVLAQTAPPTRGNSYANDEIKKLVEETYVPYAFEKLSLNGSQIKLQISGKSDFESPEKLGIEFLWIKLSKPELIESFLKSKVNIIATDLETGKPW